MQTITRFSFLLLGGAALSAAADDPPAPPKKPNFSGRWKVDLDRSDFASLPAPRSLVRTIEQDPLHLTILVETVGRDGQQATGELRFALDGEDSVNEVNGSRVEGFARQLGSHVLLHTSRSVEGTRFEIDELWSLSTDGRSLLVEGEVISDLGEEELFVVLNKQEVAEP